MKKMKQLELPLVFKDKKKEDSFAEFLARNRELYDRERMRLRGYGTTSATSGGDYRRGWLRWTS